MHPTFTKGTENEQAFHPCRSCRLFASLLASVVETFVGLEHNDQRNSDSSMGERGRRCSGRRARGDGMAGAALVIQWQAGEHRQALLVVKRFRPPLSPPSSIASKFEVGSGYPSWAETKAGVKASTAHNSQPSSPSIEDRMEKILE